jgi:uncharacterized membrane protein
MSATAVRPAVATTRAAVPRGAALPYLLAAALFLAYACWSIHRHLRLRTSGYDLGIFEQAIRGYAHLGAPDSTIKAPGFGLAYGMSWGLQSAVDFDFHEVAFAVPLLAFGLTALVERRWAAAAAWTLPLIAVKEDLPATVAVIGLLLALRGRRCLGAATILVAVCSGLAIVSVILPALNPAHIYPYAASTALDGQDPLHRLLLPAIKLRTLLWLLAPTLFLALRSPLRGLLSAGTGATDAGARQVRLALARIPDNARVAADNRLAPQLTSRYTAYFFPAYPQADVRPEWIAISNPPDTTMATPETMAAALGQLPAYGYQVSLRTSSVIIFHRSDVDRPANGVINVRISAWP